jgi:hypothetical protein
MTFMPLTIKLGFGKAIKFACFLKEIGILLQRKLVDTRMIEDSFGGAVARAWEKVKKGVIRARQQLKNPTIYYYFEYLQ